jgi:hypothetical protein
MDKRVSWENLKNRIRSESLGLVEWMTLIWVVEEQVVTACIGLI